MPDSWGKNADDAEAEVWPIDRLWNGKWLVKTLCHRLSIWKQKGSTTCQKESIPAVPEFIQAASSYNMLNSQRSRIIYGVIALRKESWFTCYWCRYNFMVSHIKLYIRENTHNQSTHNLNIPLSSLSSWSVPFQPRNPNAWGIEPKYSFRPTEKIGFIALQRFFADLSIFLPILPVNDFRPAGYVCPTWHLRKPLIDPFFCSTWSRYNLWSSGQWVRGTWILTCSPRPVVLLHST